MKNFSWKAIGPGLIWAAAAIGVSHLVQSTRAGADYGFQLIIVILLANLFKYPFFEYGPRYAIATGESLVEGYRRMGKWVVILFLILTIGTMFTIQAAVTSVTVGIITSIIPTSLSYVHWTIILLLICALIILIGRYKILDRLMKGVVLILTISTLLAITIALIKGVHYESSNQKLFEWKTADIAFLIALVGWMPSAIDISVWNSLWTLAKMKDTGYRPKLKEALLDFNIGYAGTVFLALCFLGLGAFVMYGSGETFSGNGTIFANQLFALYTRSIGKWAFPIIAVAALATMFSTTFTVLDAYPRVLNPVTNALFPKTNKPSVNKLMSYLWMTILVAGAVSIILVFTHKMKLLVDIATSMSFITAPVLGFMNLKAVTSSHVSKEFQPGLFLRILSWVGLIVLSSFAIYFILLKLNLV
jgi:Mn2+/Fe2+ NRAMP family transporter